MVMSVPLDVANGAIELAPDVEDARENVRVLSWPFKVDPRVINLLLVEVKS